MTNEQKMVVESLSKGILPIPFKEELDGIRAVASRGPMTSREKSRLSVLESAFSESQKHGAAFHSAVVSGDLDAAQEHSEAALTVAEGVM